MQVVSAVHTRFVVSVGVVDSYCELKQGAATGEHTRSLVVVGAVVW